MSQIEVNSNALFLSTFGVKIDVKNERRIVSRMCENAYLSLKNPIASRALKWALNPSHRLLASLTRLRFTTSATFSLRSWGPPLDQILDPHLQSWQCWHSRTTSNGTRLEVVTNGINFTTNLHLSWCFKLKVRWLTNLIISFSKLKLYKNANVVYYGKTRLNYL